MARAGLVLLSVVLWHFPTHDVLPYSALQVPIASTFNLHFPLNFLFFISSVS